MNHKFKPPKFKFKAPKFGAGFGAKKTAIKPAAFGATKSSAATFGIENHGTTLQTQIDEQDWGIFRRFNNREVSKRKPSMIQPMHANFVKRLMPAANHESFLLLNGNCQGVDVLMAMIAATTAKHGPPQELILSSLSMNMDTIEKLESLPVKKQLLISSYFLATNPKNIVGRLHREGKLKNWKIGMWRNHTKHALWSCGGQWFFFHGSANLRSSGSIESMSWYNHEGLYRLNRKWMLAMIAREPIEKYLTTGKTNTNGFYTPLENDDIRLGMASDGATLATDGLDMNKIIEFDNGND